MHVFLDTEVRGILKSLNLRPSEQIESETIEFKEFGNENALHNSKELAEEICALANHRGGIVVIGVRDSSNVSSQDWSSQLVGFPKVDEVETRARLCGRLRPHLEITVRNLAAFDKNFVVIRVPNRTDTLVTTSSGKTYIRDGRSSRPMGPDEIEAAVKSLVSYDWSGDCIDLDAIESIDPEALAEALADFRERRQIDAPLEPARFLEAIGATRNGQLTKAGLVFLGKEDIIRQILGDYEFRFSWKTPTGELLVNDVWSGCLWKAVLRAREHFNYCNRIQRYKYKDKDFTAPLLDGTAFHEAYLNALVHRDYSSEGMVTVNFSGDKLVITSPGKFYGGITSDNIALHEPRHRNKALARILMEHKLVDRAGMGVLRMGLGSLRYGRSFPAFREAGDSVEVSMDARHIKAPIAALALDNADSFGIPELLILNVVHEAGVVAVEELEERLSKVNSDPWSAIRQACEKIPAVELCGTKDGIFVRVLPEWKSYLEVGRVFALTSTTSAHVKLFGYLRKQKQATNADIRELLGHAYSSQTSKFLREAKYVKRTGLARASVWKLSNDRAASR